MRKLQKGNLIRIIIFEWGNLIIARLVDAPDTPQIEIKFSRLVIEDDTIKIESTRDSGFIYASLLKISNAKWLVDEIIY